MSRGRTQINRFRKIVRRRYRGAQCVRNVGGWYTVRWGAAMLGGGPTPGEAWKAVRDLIRKEDFATVLTQ